VDNTCGKYHSSTSIVVVVVATKLGFNKATYLRFKIILMIDVWVTNRARVKNTRAKLGR
jgi:hypothetical protein